MDLCLEDNTYIRTGTTECKFQYKAPKVRQGSVKRICHTLCHEVGSTVVCKFLCRRCTTATWMCQISRFVEDENRRQQLSSSLPELWYIPLEFNSFFSVEIVSGSKRPRFYTSSFLVNLITWHIFFVHPMLPDRNRPILDTHHFVNAPKNWWDKRNFTWFHREPRKSKGFQYKPLSRQRSPPPIVCQCRF